MSVLGALFDVFTGSLFGSPTSGGKKAPTPPSAPPAPSVGTAPMTTDAAAQTAATEAGIQQSKYGGGTVLTSGKGVGGAPVVRPGLTAPGQTYPTLFAKYLGE